MSILKNHISRDSKYKQHGTAEPVHPFIDLVQEKAF